jgi:hypothetical protein
VTFPVIAPGWDGISETEMLSVRDTPEPQELLAVTETFPLAAPAVTDIDAETELPLQPEGSVHVYEVAPETEDML